MLLYGIIILLLHGRSLLVRACSHPSDKLFDVSIFNFDTDYRFTRSDNINDSTLHVVYTWDVYEPRYIKFDGFLYKFLDSDKEPDESDIFEGFYEAVYDKNACVGLNSTLWATDKNSSSVLCNIPCKKYFPQVCNYSKVCTLRKMNYTPLRKTTRRLELPIKFGRVYDLHLMIYKNWHTGQTRFVAGSEVVLYCKHELIQKQNVTHDEAHSYCKDNMEYTESARESGPVSHFQQHNVVVDLTTNKASVTFRWKAPYDIAPNMSLSGFHIYTRGGDIPRQYSRIRSDRNADPLTTFYNVTIYNVTLERHGMIMIIPIMDDFRSQERRPVTYGVSLREYFRIPDINACDANNGVGRYCSENAKCIDSPATSDISANCTCPDGYSGNGISITWTEGTGCFGPSSLVDGNRTCDPFATYVVYPTPSREETCNCPKGYIGDGFKDGSGCTSRNLIIGLSIGIPLAIVILGIGVWLIVRSKKENPGAERLEDETL